MTSATGSKRSRRTYEAPDMAAFVGRTMRAMVRRADDGDLEVMSALASIQADLADAQAKAAAALRGKGYSWTDIGRELGMSRQAAQQRFSR